MPRSLMLCCPWVDELVCVHGMCISNEPGLNVASIYLVLEAAMATMATIAIYGFDRTYYSTCYDKKQVFADADIARWTVCTPIDGNSCRWINEELETILHTDHMSATWTDNIWLFRRFIILSNTIIFVKGIHGQLAADSRNPLVLDETIVRVQLVSSWGKTLEMTDFLSQVATKLHPRGQFCCHTNTKYWSARNYISAFRVKQPSNYTATDLAIYSNYLYSFHIQFLAEHSSGRLTSSLVA